MGRAVKKQIERPERKSGINKNTARRRSTQVVASDVREQMLARVEKTLVLSGTFERSSSTRSLPVKRATVRNLQGTCKVERIPGVLEAMKESSRLLEDHPHYNFEGVRFEE